MTPEAQRPQDLLTDGRHDPIGTGSNPVLTWRPSAQRAAQVQVADGAGDVIWDSGMVTTSLPRMRFDGPAQRSRAVSRWRVRVTGEDGRVSEWSDWARWETGLLDPGDWSASWIGRRTDPARRVVRSLGTDHVAWIEPGQWLGQTVAIAGEITAVSVDLTSAPGDAVAGRLELCTLRGDVLASQVVEKGAFRWDRFAHFLEAPAGTAAGEYLVRVSVQKGRIGWRTLSTPEQPVVDDGISPLPVRGQALRDGVEVPGVRAVGIETIPAPNPMFRAEFTVDAAREARLYAVGLGYGEFSINGQPVTSDVLEPPQTNYGRTILHRTYDVAHLLRPGKNTLVAELGRGFFAARGANTWAWNLAPWHREPVLIAQLEYLDGDGRRQVVGTGNGWETADSAVTSDLLYTGETTGQAGEHWEPAALVAPPGGRLVPAEAPPIRRRELIAPVATHQLGLDTTVYDFGTVLAGRVRCTVAGETGAEIVIRYGEQLAQDGSVLCDNPLTAGEAQVDRLVITDSQGERSWEPKFSYKGFQYVSVQISGRASVTEVNAVRLQAAVDTVGEFECDDETITWIDAATGGTFLNNLHGIPTDTPVYEKNGWTADAHLATEAVLHHFDLRTTFGKWLDDHVDARDDHGMVPQIVPTPDWGRAADPAWSASMVLIPWNLYWEYGERAILERYADAIRAYADRLLELTEDGLWPQHSWGDWLAPGHKFAPEGPMPTATMMLYRVITRTADICRELGLGGEHERYDEAARAIATAYHRKFFDAVTGTYRASHIGYRQAMNVLPLAFGAVPRGHVGEVAAGLFSDIEHRTRGHLDCGAVAVKHLLPVLSDNGRSDLAVTVATRSDRPSWGVWRQKGASTLRESWDESARSRNHYFLGSVSAWIHQTVGGLRATSPGWESIDIAPIVDDRVRWARIAHTTVRGRAAVEWRRSGAVWDIDVEVPNGATAALRLPGAAMIRLPSGRHVFDKIPNTSPGAGTAQE
ncbi:glycoside hydrolase family 78 protein [Saccharopolyspora sp. K220]|uniref:family 78 glycoside hydrolase catalytic domain n=1 Tax=Saccharopolyspora soli TaxID=2926618 RepID=UPI001F57F91E|nr:family 78 glycoside hydrolase catalytic domain [Saccharopolyspora soli]MCI2419500.1 glycoside hydrolase family 78 protein [Saccharopolyspora soli]